MANEDGWEPGVPLFEQHSCFQQPMFCLKDDTTEDACCAGARWNPTDGWRYV